jgi:hypothetical protein
VPDSNDLDITGDFSGMVDMSAASWVVTDTFLSKQVAGTSGSWQIAFLVTSGLLRLRLSEDGLGGVTADSSAAPVVSAGGFICIGWTWRQSDGRVQFFTAPTGTTTHPSTWTQLGTDKTIAIASINASTNSLLIGVPGTLSAFHNGTFRRVRLWASIDGTDQRFDANFVGQTKTATRTPSTITESAKSATVTMNGTGWDWAT